MKTSYFLFRTGHSVCTPTRLVSVQNFRGPHHSEGGLGRPTIAPPTAIGIGLVTAAGGMVFPSRDVDNDKFGSSCFTTGILLLEVEIRVTKVKLFRPAPQVVPTPAEHIY